MFTTFHQLPTGALNMSIQPQNLSAGYALEVLDIPGEVRAIEPGDPNLKIPHMGWNILELNKPHALLDGISTGPDGQHAYFVHSFHLVAQNGDNVIATTDYGGPVTAIVARDNLVGTQFHPEKSQRLGLKLIGNFLTWKL